MPHFLMSGNFNPLQSAYRIDHSTQTALLRTLNSLYKSIDTTCLTTLIGLDLSAAFDTISHSILLGKIRDKFGVLGAPLCWLHSYLTDRRHYVKLGASLLADCSVHGGCSTRLRPGPESVRSLHVTRRSAHYQPWR